MKAIFECWNQQILELSKKTEKKSKKKPKNQNNKANNEIKSNKSITNQQTF